MSTVFMITALLALISVIQASSFLVIILWRMYTRHDNLPIQAPSQIATRAPETSQGARIPLTPDKRVVHLTAAHDARLMDSLDEPVSEDGLD